MGDSAPEMLARWEGGGSDPPEGPPPPTHTKSIDEVSVLFFPLVNL